MADNSNTGSTTRGQRGYTGSPRDGSVSPKRPPQPEFPPEEDRTNTEAYSHGWQTNYPSQPAYKHSTVPRSNPYNTNSSHSSHLSQSNPNVPRAQAQTAASVSHLGYSNGTTTNNGAAQAVQYQQVQATSTSVRGYDQARQKHYTATYDNITSIWSYKYD